MSRLRVMSFLLSDYELAKLIVFFILRIEQEARHAQVNVSGRVKSGSAFALI